MAETLDRSILESKAVAELREIAKSLDVKVGGLKKAEIIEAIAQRANGAVAASSSADDGARVRDHGPPMREQEVPGEVQRASAPPAPPNPAGDVASDAPAPEASGVRDETAVDDSERSQDDRGRRPQGRDQRTRPREKAEPRGRRRRRGRGGEVVPRCDPTAERSAGMSPRPKRTPTQR